MIDSQLSFKISSGLKNIIGRDLITDDYVAVFELVKNSFDAYAKKVTITFSEDKIKIIDDGKGMNLEDIKNKWLFVAYSAKKEGVEDKNLNEKTFENYRDKIRSKKYYAGAKGIGRFSCDRLGSKLLLTTREANQNSKIEQIEVNWNDFDKNPEEGFIDIKVKHRTIDSPNEYKKLVHGTRLEISNLNSNWDRNKKIGLKHSLEKLINPFDNDSSEKFSIVIIDESEVEADKSAKLLRDKVNGDVRNFIFEQLELKTTQILTEIDSTGEYLTISLKDRGVLIYKIRKKNRTNPRLQNITFNLFFLNKAAKSNFSKLMGIDSVNFGSIFLYKNGFRIAPYGDVGYDYFGLDSRKAQKHFDRLGSRDLIGRIELLGDNPNFKETSSRDGGLVRNEYYHALVQCFISQCLIKLEDYLNEVQWTNKEDKNREDLLALKNIKAKSALLKLINDEIEIDDESELLDADRANINLRTQELLEEASEKDIKHLQNIALKLKDKSFVAETENLENERLKNIELQKQLKAEEEARLKVENELKEAERLLELEKEKNTYLRTSTRSISEDAKGLVHNIKITTRVINSNIDTLYDKVRSGKINNEELLRRLGTIKFNADKALKISKLITRSNFKAQQNEQVVDVVKYIKQYIEVYSDIYEKSELDFEIIDNNACLIKKISVLDVSVILDDLISNAEKAKAKHVKIEIIRKNDGLQILFSDNGSGVPNKFVANPEEMFELGVTTTDGSGIGLFSIRTALKAINGSIRFVGNNKLLKGATFEIILK